MPKIIAEAGVNHNGSSELAFRLIDAAHEAGADIVKFQTFKANNLVTRKARQAAYQLKNTGVDESQYSMLSRLELDFETHKQLLSYCNKKGIEFLSTAFDSESLRFLVNDLGLTTLKIPSGELTNAPLVLEHAVTGNDLIVSTGMATMAEIESVLGVVAFGLLSGKNSVPSVEAFKEAYISKEGQEALSKKVSLLHCTTEYPAPVTEVNLNAMTTLKDSFGLEVGYSDHTAGIVIPIAASVLGAQIIEKHFTLDKTMEGPDHKSSLEPHELKQMVDGIREVRLSLGNGIKIPQPSEIKNRNIARKCIVAASTIERGAAITAQNIALKRANGGLSPYEYWSILDTVAQKSYSEGDVIDK
jgi:N-acetylneuraminate synthase